MGEPIRPDDVEALIADFEASGCSELHVRFEGFELHLSSDPATQTGGIHRATATTSSAPVPVVAPGPAAPAAAADDLEGFAIVRAPYLGTFYRAPKPGEPAYVELGSSVTPESDICLVEVMKLFTAVRAGVAGTIARILATDGQMVEAGQPLFAIDAKG